MTIGCVVGARPNFMKMAPVVREMRRRELPVRLVHTGQHYDERMSEVFFRQLGLPEPDEDLGVGSGSHAEQTARVMTLFERICLDRAFDLVVVAGDVNSTLAATLAAVKLGIPVAHLEAGLRSFDRTMPEEANRVVTDVLSEILLVTERSGVDNLRREGIPPGKIHLVGNCMVDTLLAHREAALALEPWRRYGFQPGGYALLTLHRPSNVDDPATFGPLLEVMAEVGERVPVIFPVHPRTRERMAVDGIPDPAAVILDDPLPYLEFLGLMARARLVLTDSGGIQEETTALHVPCLTLRKNTERPVTLEEGTNRLVGTDRGRILEALDQILAGKWTRGRRPPLWDGKSAPRAVDVIGRWLESKGETA
jgi:UDP-N-acetylglucosamine 2-epimerase (non-hydrolysing)